MGEPVNVAEKKTAKPGVIRFETDRPLTGMGHRSYAGVEDSVSVEDPADEIAKALFERGGVERVHVYGNVVTVELGGGDVGEGIKEMLEGLFIRYAE